MRDMTVLLGMRMKKELGMIRMIMTIVHDDDRGDDDDEHHGDGDCNSLHQPPGLLGWTTFTPSIIWMDDLHFLDYLNGLD
eukprot:10050450-Karenia_brevis.AAC.1